MRNCLILGCGRSGTSLVAGLLQSAGYHFGPDLLEPDSSNPRGYFESRRVNEINEAILAGATPSWWIRLLDRRGGFRDAGDGLRWLNRLPAHWTVRADPEQRRAIGRLTTEEPFCFKDPRFCYTLPCWEDALDDPVVLYVLRHPLDVARSMVKHARRRGYADRLGLDLEGALAVWRATNRYALTNGYGAIGTWRVVKFTECFEGGPAVEVVEAVLGIEADTGHADRTVPESRGTDPVPSSCRALYRALDDLAERSKREVR